MDSLTIPSVTKISKTKKHSSCKGNVALSRLIPKSMLIKTKNLFNNIINLFIIVSSS